jgi:hypothetical protein
MKAYKVLAVTLSSLFFCSAAYADVVYENGALNGTFQGAQISPPQALSDSFTVSGQSTLTSATIGLFVPTGSVPVSVTWSIGSQAFGSDLGTDTVLLSNTLVSTGVNGTSDVYLSTFGLNLALGPGDYWFTLGNATSSTGDPVGWDINFGPSSAFYMNGPNDTGPADSEYFRLEGTLNSDTGGGATVPEPASLAIFAAGLVGAAASRRRKSRTLQ